MPRILWRSALTGVIFGPILDSFGIYLGLCYYALGSGPFFLALNGIFLYGIFFAHILLMQKVRFPHFFLWIMGVVSAFEFTNIFIPIYTYTFAVPSLDYFSIAFGAPLVIALHMALTWHVLLGYRFVFIEDLYK